MHLDAPDIENILKWLESTQGIFPREALESAIANRDLIIPGLLKIIEQAKENPQDLIEREKYMGHIYAMYLLAQFREKGAYPVIVDFFSIPGEISLDSTGDVVTEDLGRILASVSRGDTSLMTVLVENRKANEYVRNAALRGLLTLVACYEKCREEVMGYYENLFRGRLSGDRSYVWNGLVSCSTDLYPGEVYEEIKQAFGEGLVETSFIDLMYVGKVLSLGRERVLEKLRLNGRYTLITDTISELEHWDCFEKWAERRPGGRKDKIGRNEPCPCGSGKKYKKCCGC